MGRIGLRIILIALVAVITGCGSDEMRFRVCCKPNQEPVGVAPLRFEITPIDTSTLDEGHPFCWRDDKLSGFLLFDLKVVNEGDKDILCLVGHRDFPNMVAPRVTVQNLMPGVSDRLKAEKRELVTAEQLQLAELGHEQASVLLPTGYRFNILDHGDFCARYSRMMQKEMKRAAGLAFIPVAGSLIASSKISQAGDRYQERQIRAEQKVLYPGVIPAGSMVRGYLVFAWPEELEPGEIVLRLPVQPGHSVEQRFDVVLVGGDKAADENHVRDVSAAPKRSGE